MMTAPFDEAGFRTLTQKIAKERGFGCANYKDGCLRRRIAVRMRARGMATYDDYRALLERDAHEWDLLLDALTVNVTKLYRDAEAWNVLANTAIPAIWDLDQPRLTVWSAGCSSGEELYTLAALFHRHAERTASLTGLRRLRIIGSDIDRASLEAARTGAYGEAAFSEMPADLRARYFSREAPHRASAELRDLIEVEKRDLLLDPPPQTEMQMITCRNVVIYFDRPSQVPLMQKFREAIAPGGYLLLGKVETLLGETRGLFEVVDARQRLFRRSA